MQQYIALVLGYLTMIFCIRRYLESYPFASASHAGKSIFPVGSVKIINFSDDTITVTASPESDHALKIVVPPHSEAALTSGPLSHIQASTSGGSK